MDSFLQFVFMYMYMSTAGALGCPWRELPYKNNRGACQKLWKEPMRGTNILFVGIAFFQSLWRTNSNKHIIYCHIFPAQFPVKRDHRSPCRGPYEAEHTKRYQNCLSFKVHVHLAPPVPAPSWCRGHRIRHNGTPPHQSCLFNPWKVRRAPTFLLM